MKHVLLTAAAAALLAACGQPGDAGAGDNAVETTEAPLAPAEAPEMLEALQDVSAATYSLERNHAFLTFKVGHNNGLSDYRVIFTDYDADLVFDPADPEAAQLTVTVDPTGLETNYPSDYKASHPDSAFESWEEDLAQDAKWFNAGEHGEITFASTGVARTGDMTGKVTGDLTLLGVTRPVTLDVTFNGSGNAPWFGERDLIGFDAETTIKRSDFGMDAFIPMIGDEVRIEFTGEFLQDE